VDLAVFKKLEAHTNRLQLLWQKHHDNQLQKNVHENMDMATQMLYEGDIEEAYNRLVRAHDLAKQIQNPNNIELQSYIPVEDLNIAIEELSRRLENNYNYARDLLSSNYADEILTHVQTTPDEDITCLAGRHLYSQHETELHATIKGCFTSHWKKFHGRQKPQEFINDITKLVTDQIKNIGRKKQYVDLMFFRYSTVSIHNVASVMQRIRGIFAEYIPNEKAPYVRLTILAPYEQELNSLPTATICRAQMT